MAVAYGEQDAGGADPRYQQGLTHLQTGRWQEALRCFEELAQVYPQSASVRGALEEARFKLRLDPRTRVRGQRWVIGWRWIISRIVLAAVLIIVGLQGVRFLLDTVSPYIARVRVESRQARLLASGNAFLKAGQLDAAEARYGELLVEVPGHPEAQRGLQQIAVQRELAALYGRGVALQEAGEVPAALAVYAELAARVPEGYRDVPARVMAIERQQETERLYAEAEADYAAGRAAGALAKYRQLRELNVSFHAEEVTARLYALYLGQGRESVKRSSPEGLRQALDYFHEALTLKPRDPAAQQEERMASLCLQGQTAYYEGHWEEAIAWLRQVYDDHPNYLDGLVLEMLYDAYIRSGEQREQQGGDLYLAYEQYAKAGALPVGDKALAVGRMAALKPRLTPTVTPTNTPLPTPTLLPTRTLLPKLAPAFYPTRQPTPTPTPTPMPLDAYRGRIVFFSAQPGQAGLWAMDAEGGNRAYIGDSPELREQYKRAFERTQFSPDGNWRAIVQGTRETTQIYILATQVSAGIAAPRQITRLSKLNYDPVWSPDGRRIALISQTTGRDEIWVIGVDGSGLKELTANRAFDKHPSWSPDSGRLAFWSNREGTKQIFIMDADGRNARNISNTSWDEYDPLWIR